MQERMNRLEGIIHMRMVDDLMHFNFCIHLQSWMPLLGSTLLEGHDSHNRVQSYTLLLELGQQSQQMWSSYTHRSLGTSLDGHVESLASVPYWMVDTFLSGPNQHKRDDPIQRSR